MKLKFVLLFLLANLYLSAFAQKNKSSALLPRPKLVVGIMVDQMRWDFLYRYYDRYQNGGFKRMLNEGFTCENTYIDYIPSVTGIGHTTVYTGSVPAIHGIAGNEFIEQTTGRSIYCAEDSTVQTVGSTNLTVGKMSPRNMLSTSITDELKLATNFRSKVIGIAIKDRGGILPAGHSADAAYWFDGSTGNWVTSTYYMKELPTWLKAFNDQKLPEKYLKQDWNTLYPINTYLQSTADDSKYEGKFLGTTAPTLPLKTSQMMSRGVGMVSSTPYGNSITLDLAKAAIDNEGLGSDAITDLLAISFSSPDYIGHQFGPNSVEIEDTYLRLDRDIANLFDHLDVKVGKGNYSVFLTADHGVANNANFLLDNKIPAGLYATGGLLQTLNNQLEKDYKTKNMVLSFGNYQVSLNNTAIAANKLNETDIRKKIIAFLQKQKEVAFAIDINEVQTASIPEVYRSKIINGYNKERSGVIQIILKPGIYSGFSATGTTHGSLAPYDTHIPLLFMGWGIKSGKSNISYNMSDIASTVSALLRIQEPNGNIGKPITEVLK
ncbi:MAG TPA: alkaline phosphatase PafA [Sphingobacteriaceae bacterium]|nr:alkaline phosphatase PafA [Sphingobacteriaceae bacterium]